VITIITRIVRRLLPAWYAITFSGAAT
jgi:hypothetical protein